MSALVGSTFASLASGRGDRVNAYREAWDEYRGRSASVMTYFHAALGYFVLYFTINMPAGVAVALLAPAALQVFPWGPGLLVMSMLVPWIGCGLMVWGNFRRPIGKPPTLLDDICILGASLVLTGGMLLYWVL